MTISALRRRLDELGLGALLAALGRSGVRHDDLAGLRPHLAEPLAAAVDLLCLGEEVPAARAEAALGGGVAALVDAGVAVADGGSLRLDDMRLVDHFGALVLVALPGEHRHGYYGADSVGLGRLLLGRGGGACLDLFASTGAQSVLLARGGGAVTAVEIDDELAAPLRVNLEFNGCAGRVAPVWGDVREAPLGGPYDVVALNAPLVPSFGVPGLPRGADGGVAGRSLLEAALERVELRRGGELAATATIVGSGDGPQLDWLRDLSSRRGIGFRVLATGVGNLATGAFGRELAATLAAGAGEEPEDVLAQLRERWAAEGIDRVYFCLLTGSAGAPGVDVVSARPGGRGWWL